MPAPSLVKLDFQEKLIQSGRKENTEAVLKRIKTLHQKLAVLEQETTDTSSLKAVCKQLVSELILHHKDRGVKAYAACCLADSLRICAPNAPYTMDQLRDIFQFFVAQLTINLKPPPQNARLPPIARNKSITDSQFQSQSQSQTQASQRVTEVPYYNEYCYLLESLATIKSASLACDVPDSEEILTGFFDGFTEVVRPDMSKSVIRHLGEILVCLVDEAQVVPAGVLDCIIGQFTEFASRPETPSFQLIVDVCNKTAERLTRPVYAHFSNIQLEHGRNPSQEDLKTLAESHTLLLNIFRFSPGLLLNVVPLLEANLKAADEVPLRQLSTKTLGRMFGERPVVGTGRADLAKAYPSAWRSWLGRKVDKALSVRLAWVESTRGILCNHPELRRELEAELNDRIHDADERVRAAICKVIGSLDFETALHHISEETLKAVGGRMSDKRSNVRSEAASALGKLWSLAYTLIESNDADVVAQFAWIPEMMLLSLLKRDVTIELKTQISHIFETVILPLPEQKADIDVQAWVDRLLLVSSHLNTPAFGALKRLTGLIGFARGGSPYRAFVDFCEANNGGEIDQDEEKVKARLEFVISAIARVFFALESKFVDVEKARKDMESFAAINEQKLYRLYKICVDVHSDLESLVKSRHELRRRLEQHHSDILDTFTTILDVGSWNIINQSSIPPLIAALQKTPKGPQGETITQAAREWLRLIAKEGALMFKSHIPILVKEMDNKKPMLSEAALQGLAAVVKADKESCPTDSRILDKAHKLAMEGTPKQAKYAARFLAFTRKDDRCSDLVDDLRDKLNVKNKLLVTHLSALAELTLSIPESTETRGEEIIDFITKKVINAVSPSAGVEDTGLVDDWVDESELEMLDRAKLVSLRFSAHRAIGLARASDRLEILAPVVGLLDRILRQDGQQSSITNEGCHARVHMRYRATTCFLKLAKVKDFDKAMSPYFETIATMTLDPSETVRHRLLIKLSEVLPTQRLLPRWNIIPAMSASDPEPENIALAKSIMLNNIRACSHLSSENRIERIEMPLARLILTVSHLDEEWDLEGMKVRARILELYLEAVTTKDNVDLLYHIAGKIKTVRDVSIPIPEGEGSDADEDIPEGESKDAREERVAREIVKKNKRVAKANSNLYSLSELTQLIIRNKAHQHNWPISTYIHPGSKSKTNKEKTNKEKEAGGEGGMAKDDEKVVPTGIQLPKDIFHNLTNHQAQLDNIRNKFLDDDIADHVKGLGRRGFVAKRVTDRTSPVKRTKPASKKPRKRSKKTAHDSDSDDDDEDSDSSGSDLEEEEGDVEMEEEGESAGVVGRGGRRGAKTKAKKAVRPKKKRNSKSKSVSVSAEESDLTEEDE